jgi:NADH dehydrogenase
MAHHRLFRDESRKERGGICRGMDHPSQRQRVFVTGGTGFVGSAVLAALADRQVRMLTRSSAGAGPADDLVEQVSGDVTDPNSLHGAMNSCDALVHLVAIIKETGKATFDRVIRQGTENVLAEAERAGVRRVIYVSALGARNDPHFTYLHAKYQAETAVIGAGIPWTIFRPSVIFGPEDEFINTLANLVRRAPVIPVVGDGKAKFQPVAVNQVATAIAKALDDPATIEQRYDLGGGTTYTYEQMIDLLATKLDTRKPKVHVPVGLMRPVVALSKFLPERLRPPVTEEQLKMLAIDNTTEASATAVLTGEPAVSLEDDIGYLTR